MTLSNAQQTKKKPRSRKKQLILDWCRQRAPNRKRIPKLLRLIKNNYSLGREEKSRVLRQLPALSQFQIDDLIRTFKEQERQYKNLSEDHPGDVKKLRRRARQEWKVIAADIVRLAQGQRAVQRLPLPQQLLEDLQMLVIGQQEAQEQVVTALYYQALMALADEDAMLERVGYEKGNTCYRQPPLLLAGPTGCGKTHLMREAARLLDLNLVIIDASTLVREGIVGTSVSDIAIQIQEQANYDMNRALTSVVVLDEFDKLLLEDPSGYNRAILHQLLTLLEGTTPLRVDPHRRGERRNPKLELELPTDRLLFVLAGAFEGLRSEQNRAGIGFVHQTPRGGDIDDASLATAGIPGELRGRLGAVINLAPLEARQLVQILHRVPHSPLVRLHQELALFDFELEVDDNLLLQMAEQSLASGLGARGLYQAFNMLPSVRQLRLTAPGATELPPEQRRIRLCGADADTGLVPVTDTTDDQDE